MELYSWLDNVPAVHGCFKQFEDRLTGYGRQPEEATLTLYRQLTGS